MFEKRSLQNKKGKSLSRITLGAAVGAGAGVLLALALGNVYAGLFLGVFFGAALELLDKVLADRNK